MRRTATPARVAVAVVLLAMVALEAVAMRNGTLGIVLIGVAAGLAVVLVLSRADLVKIALGAALISAFTLTWNGWYVGPVRPGDVLPFVTLIAFAFAAPKFAFRTPPWWIKQLALGLIFLLVITVVFPVSLHYLDSRLVVDAGGNAIVKNQSGYAGDNVAIIAKFIVAIFGIPLAFIAAARINRRMVRWLALAFTMGTSLSGFVAFVDKVGPVNLSHYITRISNGSTERTAGFTIQPNFLAETLVLAAPFACWMITSRVKWERWVGVAGLMSCVLGVYASGSRGGTACIVGAIGLAFILLPRTRPHTPSILLGTLAGVGVVAVVFPSFGLQILKVTRIYGNATTSGSDTVRDWAAAQGWKDFDHSIIHGVGMQASTDASQVYLQQLAAGGLVLFFIMSIYLLGAAWASFRLIPRTPIAAAICAAVLIKIPMNIVETSLTDRLYYVQEAILAAMIAVTLTKRDPGIDDEFDPDYVPPAELDPTVRRQDDDGDAPPAEPRNDLAVTR